MPESSCPEPVNTAVEVSNPQNIKCENPNSEYIEEDIKPFLGRKLQQRIRFQEHTQLLMSQFTHGMRILVEEVEGRDVYDLTGLSKELEGQFILGPEAMIRAELGVKRGVDGDLTGFVSPFGCEEIEVCEDWGARKEWNHQE